MTEGGANPSREDWTAVLTLWSRASDDPDTRVFLFALAARLSEGCRDPAEAIGIGPDDWPSFLSDHLPDLPTAGTDRRAAALHALPPPPAPSPPPSARALAEEMEEVRTLLLESRANESREVERMAALIARTSLFPNHLWQDLGLPDRTWLSALLRRNFPAFAAANTGDMKWKKFIYKTLCDRSGLNLCRAPSCAVCDDKPKCFGPEG